MSRARRARVSVVLAASASMALASAFVSSPARTQDAETVALAERVSGQWERAISESEARARVERGIAMATEGMPPLVDAIAARALRERTHVPPRVEIEATPARIEVELNDSRYDTRPGHPRTVPVPGTDGDTMEVVQHFRDGHLEQVFSTEQGRRWSTFVPSADGNTMTLTAVIQSSRLPAAMRFSIPYRRVAP